jgi:hypothetical protein
LKKKTKIGEEPLSFKNKLQLLRLLIKCKSKCVASEKRDGNFHIFADSRFGNSAFSSIG